MYRRNAITIHLLLLLDSTARTHTPRACQYSCKLKPRQNA
jgi:hypothetical protein